MPPAKTEYAARLPYIFGLLERTFDLRHLIFARLAVISNSVIIPHKDLLEVGKMLHRVHIPLVTNDECFFSEKNVVFRMRAGEIWFLDVADMHSAASFTEQERVHLMLDFADIPDPPSVIKLPTLEPKVIPSESIQQRKPMTASEVRSLMSLASVITVDNWRDVFSIIIKKHYRKDGGENFIWNTMMDVAHASRNESVVARLNDLYQYFMVKRAA